MVRKAKTGPNGDEAGANTGGERQKPAELKPSRGYPRPMLRRDKWWSLNGRWEFALDREGDWKEPDEVLFDRQIIVPFAPETPASGVNDTGFYQAVWYLRTVEVPPFAPGERLMLHFGAVDFRATVWVNGNVVTRHEGGYTPFCADITEALDEKRHATIVVRAEDDPFDLAKPRGKQDWELEPHSIWYPRTTGIWQTVWMEVVPAAYVGTIRWRPNVERWEIGVEATIFGEMCDKMKLRLVLQADDLILTDDTYAVVKREAHRRIALSDPGIDDFRNRLLWYPHAPKLINVHIELMDATGTVVDRCTSYTALRSIGVQGDRFVLNGRPCYLRLVLDQGYWPKTGLSSPNDEALQRDVELVRAMGFNGVRRHQKISDPRFLYWADKLGLLVWEEMPSAYRFTRQSVERLMCEWIEVIQRDASHPCIIAWVPVNESWGVPDLPDSPAQRHWVQALYHLTKTLDPTRPVIGNDGWESVATDIIGIHDYDDQPDRIRARYGSDESERLFKTFRPGGRLLLVGGEEHQDQPIMITEFGGIAYSSEKNNWGYSRAESAKAFEDKYTKLLEAVRGLPMLAGFCYTQFTDTYQEANGLVTMDRVPKMPLKAIAMATSGMQAAQDRRAEAMWRQRMMNFQREHYMVPAEDHHTRSTR
jgi:hypothetical protein